MNCASYSAQANGWPCVVLSENLTLRNYAEPSAWAEDAILVDDQLGPSAPAQPDSTLVSFLFSPQDAAHFSTDTGTASNGQTASGVDSTERCIQHTVLE